MSVLRSLKESPQKYQQKQVKNKSESMTKFIDKVLSTT